MRRWDPQKMKLRTLAVAGVAMVALTGCNTSGGDAGPSATPSVDARLAWLELSNCMRQNGVPNFPDPVEDRDGNWQIPESASGYDIPAQCTKVAAEARAKANKEGGNARTPADIAKLVQHAKCMRDHGIVNWPDPASNGDIDLPAGLSTDDPTVHQALDACKALLPASGW
jgi:hypothetical protein